MKLEEPRRTNGNEKRVWGIGVDGDDHDDNNVDDDDDDK
jgi:hypothetical protein